MVYACTEAIGHRVYNNSVTIMFEKVKKHMYIRVYQQPASRLLFCYLYSSTPFSVPSSLLTLASHQVSQRKRISVAYADLIDMFLFRTIYFGKSSTLMTLTQIFSLFSLYATNRLSPT